jgi:hypothetical protein
MKLSLILILSLVGYSAVVAGGQNQDMPNFPSEFIEQQASGFEHFRNIKIAQLRERKQKLDPQAKKCLRDYEYLVRNNYNVYVDEYISSLIAQLESCNNIIREKKKVEKALYEKEHEKN